MKAIGYLVLVAAVLLSLVFVQSLKPTSFVATLIFSTWLAAPYILFALLLAFGVKKQPSIKSTVLVLIIVAGAGLLFLTDIIFLHPDAQGGIAVLFTPVYQAIGTAVLMPVCLWLFGRFGADSASKSEHLKR